MARPQGRKTPQGPSHSPLSQQQQQQQQQQGQAKQAQDSSSNPQPSTDYSSDTNPSIWRNPVDPAALPPRPNFLNEVTFRPLPGAYSYRLAYRLWRAVDDRIDPEGARRRSDERETRIEENRGREDADLAHEWMAILAHWVYEDMVPEATEAGKVDAEGFEEWPEERFLKPSDDGGDGGGGDGGTGTTVRKWTVDDFTGDWTGKLFADPQTAALQGDLGRNDIRINGKGFKSAWKKGELEQELRRRGLAEQRNNELRKTALFNDEVRVQNEARTAQRERLYAGSKFQDSPFESRWPRTDLTKWGVERNHSYILDLHKDEGLGPVDLLTWAISLSGYNPTYWVSRAHVFFRLGYYDLALGDCYRAFRLMEVLAEASKRNKQNGLFARVWDAIENHVLNIEENHDPWAKAKEMLKRENGVNYFIPKLRMAMHHIISKCLLKLHCWRDYLLFDRYLTQRIGMKRRDRLAFEGRFKQLESVVKKKVEDEETNPNRYYFEQDVGFVAANLSPHAATDVNRSTDDFIGQINTDVLRGWTSVDGADNFIQVQQWYEDAENMDGLRLGVFATKDIDKFQVLCSDEPSARGHVDRPERPEKPHYDSTKYPHHGEARDEEQKFPVPWRCENCRRDIDQTDWDNKRREDQRRGDPGPDGNTPAWRCNCWKYGKRFCLTNWDEEAKKQLEADKAANQDEEEEEEEEQANEAAKVGQKRKKGKGKDTSQKKQKGATGQTTPLAAQTCLEIAKQLFHYKSCGKDWSWLQQAMTPIWHLDNRGRPYDDGKKKGGRYITHNNERHGTVLSMILRDVFDITLLRRNQAKTENIQAHEIDELVPLCGGEDLPDRLHPFGWAANIMVPFDTLMYLGVDIFTDLSFDTWVIQAVLRKLQMNVVPWDEHLRGDSKVAIWKKPHPEQPMDTPINEEGATMGEAKDQTYEEKHVRADIETIYLHTGFAMFNHGCRTERNAIWMWDSATPNRIIVQATKPIKEGEEVLIGYLRHRSHDGKKLRPLFGRNGCVCIYCEKEGTSSDTSSVVSEGQGQ